MIKALAADFDGTLYFHNTEERFYARDIFEILFFQKRGGLFGICTGRSPDSIFDTIGDFIRPDFIISVSGALTVDGKGNVLDSRAMDPSAAETICREFEDRAAEVIHADGRVYCLNTPEYPLQVRVNSFSEIPQDRIYGISMRLEDERAAAEAAALIEEKYGQFVSAFQNIRNVDIVAAGCSKGTGIARVRELFGIGRFGGIGDSYNDLPLIKACDVGFTFPNSPAELREAADEIVLSVSDAIEKLEGQTDSAGRDIE